jgi:hypothetical protein
VTDTPSEADGRAFRLALLEVTSFLIITQRKTRVFTGSYDQLMEQYRKVMTHNLVAGWWGIPFGLVWTPLALRKNARARKKLEEIASQPPSAAPGE